MDNEFDLDLEENINNKNNRSDKRIENLTEKLKAESERSESEAKARADAEAKAQALEKERDFYSSFSDSTSKYPNASEYKDAIKEKVMGGYTVEDATVSILAKEGKLSMSSQRENIAGGSATNALQSDGTKSISEMNRADKRAALMELEAESGSLTRALRANQ